MKKVLICVACILTSCLLLGITLGHAQDSSDAFKKTGTIGSMLEKKLYTFKAQSVTPMSGRFRQLTSEYDLQVSPDKVVSFLPYFGRAFNAVPGATNGGLQFTATDFTHTLQQGKKGKWIITLKFNNATDVRQMILTAYDNGSAYLQVTSNNRDPISFNGYIAAPDKRK